MDQMISKNTLNMQPDTQERRMMRRFDMRLPATVRLDGAGEFHTETQNVSPRGVTSTFFAHRYRRHDRGLRVPAIERQSRLPQRAAKRMESDELRRVDPA